MGSLPNEGGPLSVKEEVREGPIGASLAVRALEMPLGPNP